MSPLTLQHVMEIFFPLQKQTELNSAQCVNAYDCFIMQAYASHSLSDFKLPYKFP